MEGVSLIDNELKKYVRGLSKERQYIELYRYINSGNISTTKGLKELFGVDEKTIRNYIDKLKMLWDVKIEYDKKEKRYFVKDKGTLGELRAASPLTAEQVQTILFALANSNSFVNSELEFIKDKLFKLLYKKEEDILRKCIKYDCWNVKAEDIKNLNIFKTLRNALNESRAVNAVINNKSIILIPHGIDYQQGKHYLIAEEGIIDNGTLKHSNSLKYYNLSDFEIVTKSDKEFTRYAVNDLIVKLRNSMFYCFEGEKVTVRVKFFKKGLNLLSRRRGIITAKKVEEHSDYEIFDIESYGTEGIKAWILGFGDGAEVLEPLSLRDEMKETIAVIIKSYEGEL